MSGAAPIPTPSFWICESEQWREKHSILDADLSLLQRSGEPCLGPATYCPLVGTKIEASRGHSAVVWSQLLQGAGDHGRTSELHRHAPTAAPPPA